MKSWQLWWKGQKLGVFKAERWFWSWAEVGHIKTEGSRTTGEPFFQPWLLWPLLKPWNSRLGRDSVSWRGSGNYCSSPFIHGEHNFSPLHCTDRSWAGREQHKVLHSFHIEPLASGSMTTNATAAFSEASGKGTLERDFRDSVAGSPSVIELGTGGSRKSTAQVRPFPQRLQTKELLWSVSQPIHSKEKLKVRGKGLLFN